MTLDQLRESKRKVDFVSDVEYNRMERSDSRTFVNKSRSDIASFTEKGSYLTPDVSLIKQSLPKLKSHKLPTVKDEFDHMVNWKRVFEQIWQ